MDPSTTLVTFLLQTDPSVRSVLLIGSWDNFSTSYTMKRDVRRGRGQWRGCYSFRNIVCDDEAIRGSARRNGGLKMGATYYYYYELDGSTESYDSAEPWTTACPYLPGQTVNTLSVPVERTLRKRSASLNSMHDESFRTMDPEAKFTTPRPAPAPASTATLRRLASASSLLHMSRSPSPALPWKRFFSRRLASHASNPASLRDHAAEQSSVLSPPTAGLSRCCTPLEGSRTRNMSPESLRRFLSEDSVAPADPNPSQLPALVIPEDIAEEVDDDDNFATSATSEVPSYVTSLAPPPFQRSTSSDSVAQTIANPSSTLATARPSSKASPDKWPAPHPPADSVLDKLAAKPQARWSISRTSSVLTMPVLARSAEDGLPSFYDSNDEDEVLSSNDGDNFSYQPMAGLSSTGQAFKGYSLPREGDEVKSLADSGTTPAVTGLTPPQLLARADSGVPIGGANLLGATIDSGLDDFANELGWIVNVIGDKQS